MQINKIVFIQFTVSLIKPILFEVGFKKKNNYYKNNNMANKKFFVNVDVQSNDVVNLKADTLDITSNLASANTKRIVYWSGQYYYSNGTSWVNIGEGAVTSVGLTMPSAFTVTNSPITSSGDIAVTGSGLASQYVRGDGSLASFPDIAGGGGGQVFYFNGGTSQGTIGGAAFEQLSSAAVIGTGVDFTSGTTDDVAFANFITDVGKPTQETIPAGVWIFQCYLSASSTSSCEVYATVEVYDGSTFTVLSTSLSEVLTNSGTIDLYTFTCAVPEYTPLTPSDRVAIRFYPNNLGGSNTITLHTQNTHLGSVQTTFTTGLAALNGLSAASQYLQTGTTGSDFNITTSGSDTQVFNLPTASSSNRGALSSSDWSVFNGKQNLLVSGTNIKTINGNSVLGSGDLLLGVPMTREEFTYIGSQNFTLSGTPSYIYGVFVNGQELSSSQYSFVGTTLTIANTLQIVNGLPDEVNILYTPTSVGILEYYTKAQIDGFLTDSNIESIIGQASGSNNGYLSSTDWTDFDAKQDAITLTTNNYSGVATFSGGTLNIPNYEGFIPKLKGTETFRGVNFSNNSTTDVTSGGVTLGTTASLIARSVASTNYATKQIRKGFYASTVSTGRYTGVRGSSLLWYLGGGFKYVCDVYISDTAFGSGCRQFYGMAGQTTDLGYSDSILVSSLTNIIGVGSDALDTNLQLFYNDGSGTASKIDLGANFPANRTAGAALTTVYSIELYNAPNSLSVKYSVTNKETGDVALGTISSDLPLDTQGLNFFASRCMGGPITNTGQFDLLILGTYSL